MLVNFKEKLNESKNYYSNFIVKEDLKKSVDELAILTKESIRTKNYSRYFSALYYKSIFAFSKIFLKYPKFDSEDAISLILEVIGEAAEKYDSNIGKFTTFTWNILKRKIIPNYYKEVRKFEVGFESEEKSYNQNFQDILIAIDTESRITLKQKLILKYISLGYKKTDIAKKLNIAYDTYLRELERVKLVLSDILI